MLHLADKAQGRALIPSWLVPILIRLRIGTTSLNRQEDLTIPYLGILSRLVMAHVIQNKKKLLARLSRIRGQINGIEKALNEERDCGEVLLTLAACRGAMNALMAEILEGHVRLHLLQSDSQKDASRAAAGEELIEVIKRYLK
jgi:DNA-binding FrmR family transcriptional regulator